jgi:Uma2 family endonuclease
MSLRKFDRAQGMPGYLYELNRGVIEVMDVPHISHGLTIQAARNQFVRFQLEQGTVRYIAGGSDCKLLLPGIQSERHPDLAIYLQDPPPGVDQPWDTWIPALVIEVVSPHQESRDYADKRADYLAAGVLEYWIIDPAAQSMLVLQRRGDVWVEHRVKRTGKYRTYRLPGFEFDLRPVLAAGRPRG